MECRFLGKFNVCFICFAFRHVNLRLFLKNITPHKDSLYKGGRWSAVGRGAEYLFKGVKGWRGQVCKMINGGYVFELCIKELFTKVFFRFYTMQKKYNLQDPKHSIRLCSYKKNKKIIIKIIVAKLISKKITIQERLIKQYQINIIFIFCYCNYCFLMILFDLLT